MFALKALHIPLPGRHPPSLILENGFDKQGHGRVRTYGCGPSPTDIFGSSSTKVGTAHSEKMKQMLESEVVARMVEYEKCRKEETTTQLKQLLEAAGIRFSFQESTLTQIHNGPTRYIMDQLSMKDNSHTSMERRH